MEAWDALKRWIRKVLTGIAALLLAGLTALGNAEMPYGAFGPYHYAWTDQGVQAKLVAEEEQRVARLEGDVHEDQVRQAARPERERERDRDNKEKAAT